MIRINLLGQARPKAAKQAVPLEATLQIILGAGGGRDCGHRSRRHLLLRRSASWTRPTRASLRCRPRNASLQQIKQEVDAFESQKAVLQTAIDVIETLQKNRTGGQELLQMVANTVVRVDQLWLTSLERKGDNLTSRAKPASSTPSPISSRS